MEAHQGGPWGNLIWEQWGNIESFNLRTVLARFVFAFWNDCSGFS